MRAIKLVTFEHLTDGWDRMERDCFKMWLLDRKLLIEDRMLVKVPARATEPVGGSET